MQFIRENPELLQTFAANLLPQMLQVYNGSVVSQVRLSHNLPLVRHSTMSHFLVKDLGGSCSSQISCVSEPECSWLHDRHCKGMKLFVLSEVN